MICFYVRLLGVHICNFMLSNLVVVVVLKGVWCRDVECEPNIKQLQMLIKQDANY